MPALCSPLNGVTVSGQPAARASSGELNQRPRWYVCTGPGVWPSGPRVAGFFSASGNGGSVKTCGAFATPGAMMNVSLLKRPLKCGTASPSASDCISPWYQDNPNGELGTWITKKSKAVLGGRPNATMNMSSACPSEMIWTFAPALGRQVLAPFDTTILKAMWSSSAADTEPAPINISVELSKAALSACRCILLYLPHDEHFGYGLGKCGGRLCSAQPVNIAS